MYYSRELDSTRVKEAKYNKVQGGKRIITMIDMVFKVASKEVKI